MTNEKEINKRNKRNNHNKRNKSNKRNIHDKRKYIFWAIVLVVIAWLAVDILINYTLSPIPSRPDISYDFTPTNELLYYLDNPEMAKKDGVVIDDEYIITAIEPSKEYIDGRYDCMDFRMQVLIRLQYLYGDKIAEISTQGANMIKDAFLNAKYWMTEPGQDSVCYWSENHQILFASAEYLAGQMWRDEVFTNDGSTGAERMERARNRIKYWMEQRFYYGFSEYNSNNYYHMNIAAAANFIQFAGEEDEDIVEQMKMILDLLFYDIASNLHDYAFLAPSGRQMTSNKIGGDGDRMRQFVDYIWELNDDHRTSTHNMLLNFISMIEAVDADGNSYYEVPEVIKEIGRDNSTRVIKYSSGIDVSELAEKDLIGHEDKKIMMQLAMESFTNPEVIHNTLTYFNKHDMLRNSFVNEFKYVNLSLLRHLKLLRPISIWINPMPNGIALQRANIYSYQTEYYKLATNQAYHPGIYGAQHHLFNAVLSEDVSIFTTHPARYECEESAASSPGYWTGFGRAPHCVQYENIKISIYQLPKRANFTEFYDVPKFTHTYLPEVFLEEVIIDGRYAFARLDGAYIAIIGAGELKYLEHSADSAKAFGNETIINNPDKRFDLVQQGLNQYWIYELSDETVESFGRFRERIKTNETTYNGEDYLTYNSLNEDFSLKFNGDFIVNGKVQNFDYKRFDSEYIVAERESDEFIFNYKGYTLTLNFRKLIREYQPKR